MKEHVILVDEEDNQIGLEEKWMAHEGQGKLHRAFSVWVFDKEGKVLLQKRSKEKPLWGLYWSNSCCSHPRENESYEQAAERRVKEELGIDVNVKMITKFQYHANFKEADKLIGSESEVCALLYAVSDEIPKQNPQEIAELKLMSLDDLKKDMEENPEIYTPWFKMEILKIIKHKIV